MQKRVFLLRFSSLGDVVLTSSLIDPLVGAGFKPVLLTYAPYGELFKEDSRLSVVEVRRDSFRGLRPILDLSKELSKLSPFAVLDLHSNPKSVLLSRLIPAGVKVGYRKRSLRRRVCVFLNRFGLAEGLKEKPLNVVELYAETLKGLGIDVKSPRPRIVLDGNRTGEILSKFDLKGDEYVVLGIGARYRSKAYPHFERLAKILSEEGIRVVLVGDRRDYDLSRDWKGVLNLCGKLSLNESLHVMRGAKLFVGNDSGATHMARAVGTKVLAIYGGTHPCLGFAPYPDEGEVLFKGLPCSPCHIHGRDSCPRDFECLDIPPEVVAEKVFSLLGRD